MTPYYEDDAVTIYHGDCGDLIDGLDFDVIVTDPPYGLGRLLGGGHQEWGMHRAPGGHAWDSWAPEIVGTFPNRATHCVVWGGNYFDLPPRRGWLVWDKVVREFSSGHCELAWTTFDQPIRAFNYANGQLATEGKMHPTQKPLRLMSWCLSFLPDGPSVVLDPFMGSGTTLRAAKDRGMRAIGIELDEAYCEIAARRCAQEVLAL